jgi:hypothetical protein
MSHSTVSASSPTFTGGAGALTFGASGLGGAGAALPFTGVNIFFLVLTALTVLLMGTSMVRIVRTVTSPRL